MLIDTGTALHRCSVRVPYASFVVQTWHANMHTHRSKQSRSLCAGRMPCFTHLSKPYPHLTRSAADPPLCRQTHLLPARIYKLVFTHWYAGKIKSGFNLNSTGCDGSRVYICGEFQNPDHGALVASTFMTKFPSASINVGVPPMLNDDACDGTGATFTLTGHNIVGGRPSPYPAAAGELAQTCAPTGSIPCESCPTCWVLSANRAGEPDGSAFPPGSDNCRAVRASLMNAIGLRGREGACTSSIPYNIAGGRCLLGPYYGTRCFCSHLPRSLYCPPRLRLHSLLFNTRLEHMSSQLVPICRMLTARVAQH